MVRFKKFAIWQVADNKYVTIGRSIVLPFTMFLVSDNVNVLGGPLETWSYWHFRVDRQCNVAVAVFEFESKNHFLLLIIQ